MATMKDVSELAGVSEATVSRVLNGSKRVSEQTRQRVCQAVSELNYSPNSLAQALANQRSGSVGMMVGNLSGPFYGPLMHCIEKKVREAGQHLVVTSGNDNVRDERDAVNFLRSRKVDSLILQASALSDSELVKLAGEGIELVLMNRFVPELASRCVYIDNRLGGYLATRHLLDSGHRQIACITGPRDKQDSQERLHGYIQAMAEFDLVAQPELIVEGSYDEVDLQDPARGLLQGKHSFSAVVCGNDHIALRLYDALTEHGLKVGSDISVIGFDDVILSRYLRPQLTTVRVPLEAMAHAAAEMLLDTAQPQSPMGKRFVPELIKRESTRELSDAAQALPDQLAAQAAQL